MREDWADSFQCLAKQESLLGQGSRSCIDLPFGALIAGTWLLQAASPHP